MSIVKVLFDSFGYQSALLSNGIINNSANPFYSFHIKTFTSNNTIIEISTINKYGFDSIISLKSFYIYLSYYSHIVAQSARQVVLLATA